MVPDKNRCCRFKLHVVPHEVQEPVFTAAGHDIGIFAFTNANFYFIWWYISIWCDISFHLLNVE